MNLEALSAVIVATAGALLLGMAGLIKGMILGRLEAIEDKIDGYEKRLGRVENRVTAIEAEHRAEARAWSGSKPRLHLEEGA